MKINPYELLFIDGVMQTHRSWSDEILEARFEGRYEKVQNEIFTAKLKFIRSKATPAWFLLRDAERGIDYQMASSWLAKLIQSGAFQGTDIMEREYYFSKVGPAYTLAFI